MDERENHAPPPGYETPSSKRPASAEGSLEPANGKHDPYAAFRFRNFSFYALGNLISAIGRLMLMVSIEWEIYARTNSATALGLVGLVIALPVVVLSLPAGHVADKLQPAHDRALDAGPERDLLASRWPSSLSITSICRRGPLCSRGTDGWAESPAFSSGTRPIISMISRSR